MKRGRALAILLFLVGCTAPAPDRASPGLEAAPVLVALDAPAQAPEGSDALPSRSVAFRMPDGALRAIDRRAIAFVPRWRDGAALVDPERRVYEVRPDGQRRMLASGGSGALATDGERLAYVVMDGALGELRVHDGARERTIARGLASIGVLRVAGDRVLFVGGRPGGVAGVWVAPIDGEGARCLTNCDLVTGTDWRPRFVPPPASPDTFEIEGGAIAWIDPDGVRREAALEGSPP